MKELEQLKSMWGPKKKRSIKLIVPKVTYSDNIGSLNNEHWTYNVPYSFRDALDLQYLERRKKKKPYMIWTQGPLISFKEGDTLTKRTNNFCLQVKFATPMGWDSTQSEMSLGTITYNEYSICQDGKYELLNELLVCNQMQFLERLIYGSYNPSLT